MLNLMTKLALVLACAGVLAALDGGPISTTPRRSKTGRRGRRGVAQAEEAPVPHPSPSIETVIETFRIIRNTGSPVGWARYVGCFSVVPDVQKFWVNVNSEVNRKRGDVTSCIHECWEARRRLAVLGGGAPCICSDFVSGVARRNESQCQLPCSFNSAQVCGGLNNRVSFYFTGYLPEPEYTQVNEAEAKKLHVGCHADHSAGGLCKMRVVTSRLTLAMCLGLCEDAMWRFASVSGRATCCCSDHLAGVQTAPSCSVLCPGTQLPCGGDKDRFSVYSTGISDLDNPGQRHGSAPDYVWLRPHVNTSTIRGRW